MSDPITQQIKRVEQQPQSAEVRIELARLLMEGGRLAESIAAMQSAMALRPANLAACYNNLGVIQDRLGQFEAAADSYSKALQIAPGDFLAHSNLGDARRKLGQLEPAANSYQTAVRINPRFANARAGLGLTLYQLGRFREAIAELRAAVILRPQDSDSFTNLMLCHARLAEHDLAITAAKRALEIEPGNPELHSNLISMMNYVDWSDPTTVLKESREWDRRHGGTPVPVHHGNDRDPDRPLRIGYISPDFKEHPVAFFLEPVLANHDRRKSSTTCYAEVPNPDAITARIRASVDHWRSTVGMSHENVAEQIRADRIDILIDLCGHLVGNRLPVLAKKPAPVQVSWLGYPNTTGLAAIDYRLTDALADPVDSADQYYSERLLRLPGAFFVYRPPENAPTVAPLPMPLVDHVTFGSFNNLTKITTATADLWAELLKSIPGSRLLLAGLGGGRAEAAMSMFHTRGVAAEQIEIVGWMNFQQYLECFGRVDIALDTFPWNGHTTTCHGLWMGVPVVSLAGRTALSRAGTSVMGNLGLADDWVASDAAGYMRIARSWAQRPDELARLRGELRERMARSVLLDAAGFTSGFERALRELWLRCCV